MKTYFLFNESDITRIKIGKTSDLDQRLRQLQTSCADRLVLLGWIEGDHESVLHDLFAADRCSGEWFLLRSGRICRWLDRMRSRGRLRGSYALAGDDFSS